MKGSLALLLFAAGLFLADAKSLGFNDEMPKVLKDTMEQSFTCAMQIGPSIQNIPKIQGVEQLPEDNAALNKLWGCIWKKKAIIDEDAHVNSEKLEEYLVDLISIIEKPSQQELDHAHEMVTECKKVNASDYGLRSIKIQNCINRYISERDLRK